MSHISRFNLIGLSTGTRKDAITRMAFTPNTRGGRYDLDRGIMFRKCNDERATQKRGTPTPISRQLLAHLKPWQAARSVWDVAYNSRTMTDVKKVFAEAVAMAGRVDVTHHILKHTAITSVMQKGVTIWEAAGFVATSQETIEKVYSHICPSITESAPKPMETPRK